MIIFLFTTLYLSTPTEASPAKDVKTFDAIVSEMKNNGCGAQSIHTKEIQLRATPASNTGADLMMTCRDTCGAKNCTYIFYASVSAAKNTFRPVALIDGVVRILPSVTNGYFDLEYANSLDSFTQTKGRLHFDGQGYK